MQRDGSMGYELTSPARVNFFNGQLLTEDDFQAEQGYFRGKDQRHSCLHGSGVVCGLGVSRSADGVVIIEPGIALDPFGREIVVPNAHRLDPWLVSGGTAESTQDRRVDGIFTLCLAYDEEPQEQVRRVGGEGEEPVSSRTLETYRLLIREEESLGNEADVDGLTAEALATQCCLSADDCVTLATIVLRDGKVSVDQTTGRQQIYSTAILQQILISLARRVSDLENRANPWPIAESPED
jgi:hypothetical protein